MAKSIKRLGRGLDSLVSHLREHEVQKPPATTRPKPGARKSRIPKTTGEELANPLTMTVPIVDIDVNPFQPRDMPTAGDVLSLAESIGRSGLLHPVSVRPRAGRYELIAGERRFRAVQHLGWKEVPVHVRDATDEEMLELALVENIQREDLNPIERAKAYDMFCTQFSLKAEDVARRVGEDRTTVTNYMRLLDLSKSICALVGNERLSMGHARCLLGVADLARREGLAEAVVQNELSVRALEEIVRRERTREGASSVEEEALPTRPRSAHREVLTKQFEQALKTKVIIKEGKRKGSGRIIITYFSLDDFDRIAEQLGVPLVE